MRKNIEMPVSLEVPPALSALPQETPAEKTDPVSPESIANLADQMVIKMKDASVAISKINSHTRLLSFNAQIEAARAGGSAGAAFGVVATALRELSDKTGAISDNMGRETAEANEGLKQIIQTLTTNVRGTRLSDLALTNIDLVDRNLYERSCDVRWWATDSSSVEALTRCIEEAYRHCSHRFGLILNSYTVYYDLVLCDMAGKVVANGRPSQYASVGTDCSNSDWFQSAQATRSGEEFGFQSVHHSTLAGGQRVLVYSCCVREGGEIKGQPLGVLGIVFNWDALAQTIVHATPLSPEEKRVTRTCIVDDAGTVLADSENRALQDTLTLPNWSEVKRAKKGFHSSVYKGVPCLVGYASSPGYETYATGWHSLLIQPVN